MKILYVSHSFPPFHWRGTEVYAMELAAAMAADHEPRVFYLRDDPEAGDVSLEDDDFRGLPIHRARMRIDPAEPETYFFNSPQEAVFRELLNRIRPEVVHFLYYTGGLSLNLPKVAEGSGARVFITVTDFSGICPRGQMLDRDGKRCPGPREGLRCVPCLFDTTVLAKSPRLDRVLREYLPLWLVPARPGEELAVSLLWSAQRRVQTPYTVFLHFVDETGHIVTQSDREPAIPTTSWPISVTISDPYALSIPSAAAPGKYQLLVGLYPTGDPTNRLPVTDAGKTTADNNNRILIKDINVQP